MFFTSRESFDKTGHLMKKEKQRGAKCDRQDVYINKCLSTYLRAFVEPTGTKSGTKLSLKMHAQSQFPPNNKMPSSWMSSKRSMSAFHVLAQSRVCVSMSDLLSAPSGHSLGSQPQDLRQQLAVFVPAEGHPVWGRGRDAGGKHRLVEGLLERDGIWRG